VKRLLVLWVAVLWTVVAVAADAVPVPPLAARVTDLADILPADQRQALEARLAQIESAKGTQIAVLLLPTTQPESIEQYGIRVAEAWKIGRKGTDDGVILIVAKEDRRVRIEVGYGLEGALNDATASRIINERMTPRFRAGDYVGGLRDGVEAIAGVVEGEPLPPPARRTGASSSGGDNWLMWIFGALVFASFARRIFGGIGALMAAGAAGFFAFVAFGLAAALGVAVLVFLLSFAPPGLFLGGGRFGGGGRGGFSGGGGGFGGGGASGRW